MDEAIKVSCVIDKLPPSWKDFKVQDSDKPKGNNVVGPSVVNMVEHNNSTRYNDNKGKRKHHGNTRADLNKKAKPTCWKCGKIGHIKRDCKGINVGKKANGSDTKGSVDGLTNSLKDLKFSSGKIVSLFNVLHVLNIRKNLVFKWLNIVNDNIASAFMSTSKQNDSILWHARLDHVHFKRMQDMSKDWLISALTWTLKSLIHSDLYDLHATPSKDEALDKFKG
ncbi:zinc finger, CCHC-type containing protein [Tanacetum coccineum]